MRNLFRSFERERVRQLLISGQACVLYGAATFSEDVDIWLDPERRNVRRFLRALASCGARVYKLTPPLEPRHLRYGHGFHFTLPGPVYLDIMGHPPRVGSFAAAVRRCRRLSSAWGVLPVVAIEDLVELKKTRRLPDYEAISNLVNVRLAEERELSKPLLRWAARNSFRAEDRRRILATLGRARSVDECRRDIAADIVRLQRRDTAYWSRRINELRRLRAEGRLLPVGARVR